MFISKRKLEELIQERIKEAEERQYLLRRMGELEREIHQRIDKLGEAVYRLERMHEVNVEPEAECNPMKVGY